MASAWLRLARQKWWVLVFVPLIIHWPELSGWLSSDPMPLVSGLGRDWKGNGVLAGSPGWIDGNSGVTVQALGRLVVRDWLAGVVPWWNPYSGVGMPLAGELQPAAFFLPFVLLLGLAGGVLYLKITMQILAGLAMWGLLRQLRMSMLVAITGGVLFELNGTFAWASDSPILPIAFLPLFLMGIERAWAAARAHRPGGWVWVGVSLAGSLISGFPETAYLDGVLGLCWALLRFWQGGGARLAFCRKLAVGGVAGLLAAAPALVGFISFVGQSQVLDRRLGHQYFGHDMFAQFLFPYLFGPIFFNLRWDWYKIAGYASVAFFLLAATALCAERGRAERGLRWLLGVWIVMALAKTGNMFGPTEIWNAVPFVTQMQFCRYASPSWELCFIILAAFALEDIASGTVRARWARFLPGFLCGVAIIAVLVVSRPTWRDLGHVPGGRAWFFAAVGFGLLMGCAAWLAFRLRPGVARRVLCGVLVLEAVVQFSVPLLAGTRGAARDIDMAPVEFLRAHLGLQRFYTLGPLAPNYGAYFGVASINHNYVPQPSRWIDYIHRVLDPLADATTFSGSEPHPQPGVESRPEALRRHLQGFAQTGVKYALVPGWMDPFSADLPSDFIDDRGPVVALALQPGDVAQGQMAAGAYPAGDVAEADLRIGTYFGAATGQLVLSLCANGICQSAAAALEGAADNQKLHLHFAHPLSLGGKDGVRYRIAHVGGHSAVAVWLWPRRAGVDGFVAGPDKVERAFLPQLSMMPVPGGHVPRLVFQDARVKIFELPDVAAYFEASPDCHVQPQNRAVVRVQCTAAGWLKRRELMFPGWRARVNGVGEELWYDDIFQLLDVPAGDNMVRFDFAPPFAGLAFGLAALGAGLMGAGLLPRFTKLRLA